MTYDAVNQRLQFTVERNILGTGTNSNFNSFTQTVFTDPTSENGGVRAAVQKTTAQFDVKVDFDQTRRPLRARAGYCVDLWPLRTGTYGRARAQRSHQLN